MNIHEHQAKALLKSYGLPVASGVAIFKPDEAEAAARSLPGPLYVVKSQIHAGGRGKGKFKELGPDAKGGVRLAKSPAEVVANAKEMLGHTLVTKQTGADEQQRRHRQQRDDRGVDRPHQRLVDREVGGLAVGHPAAAGDVLCVLSDLVEHDDCVVERVTEDRQQADDGGRRDLEPDQRVDADRDDQVVEQRDDGRRRHLPLVAQRQVDDDGDDEDDEALDRLVGDLLAPA